MHDMNVLFAYRSDIDFGFHEMVGLIESGLVHYPSENTPLWYWLVQFEAFSLGWLQRRSLGGATGRRVGALSALRLVSEPLTSAGSLTREHYLELWFSESTPDEVKVAALQYLADCGTTNDLTAIKEEFDRGNYQTRRAAVDTIIRINLKDSREKAIIALFELQPENIDSNLLASLFENSASISTDILSQGVGHRCSSVRRVVVKLLI